MINQGIMSQDPRRTGHVLRQMSNVSSGALGPIVCEISGNGVNGLKEIKSHGTMREHMMVVDQFTPVT